MDLKPRSDKPAIANAHHKGQRAGGNGAARHPILSVILPTKNEAGNIEELVASIGRATAGIPTEIIFVDDSDDHTPDVISDVARRCRLAVSLIHRPPEHRGNGLGGAVAEAMRAASGRWLCVMDADLQHPPELIPRLLEHARLAGADIVVASRYARSGQATGLGSARFATSKLCTLAARLLFPQRLRQVRDPLSGYFLVRREAVDPDNLRPRGFKILLEILVRFPHLRVSEVPFRFQRRHAGHSKAATREGLRFLTLLFNLRFPGLLQPLTRFGIVGASGLIVNQLLLAAFAGLGEIHYLASAAMATLGSSLWNFALTEAWVFADRPGEKSRLHRLRQFLLMNFGTLILRGPFLVILTSGLGVHYLISNPITLLTLGLARFALCDRWIWSGSPSKPRGKGFGYDIHGIVRIASEVRLPELEHFLTPDLMERPDVSIRIGRSASAAQESVAVLDGDPHRFHYGEAFGRLGFWVKITPGEITEVEAGPLLKWSPHVLYTNVIEPILRWLFVRKGYALVHAACIASDKGAMLITAKTDTGKTTTVLRTIANNGYPCTFLSDDMTIIGRDGRILSYPKPLTISRHTLQAVSGAPLTLLERLTLHIQSRVHSRSGRRTALALARTTLPMATINAIAQILVPPPKYSIEQLIPGVTIAHEATLSRLVIIEWGSEDISTSLRQSQAVEVLLKNCEDAYGFPPYAKLAGFLYRWNGFDLRTVEREIIKAGLRGCPATLIRSQRRNWWERLPVLPKRANTNYDTTRKKDARAASPEIM